MNGIFERFRELQAATSPGLFDAIRISEKRLDFLAKTGEGAPVVLLQDSSAPRYRPGFQLRYLRAEFHTTCLIRSGQIEANGQFAIISCDPSTPELFELFVRTVTAAVADLSVGAGTDEIQSQFESLVNLFRRFAKPAGREITGLWAELFVVLRSKNIAAALSAWRNAPAERFDFSWTEGQLEVKATTNPIRAHEFALEQLKNPDGKKSYVASLLLQPLSGGMGIMDLAAAIEGQIPSDGDLRHKLWMNIASDLGNDFSELLDRQFDLSYAGRNAVLYSAGDIPAPAPPDDSRITSIRFVADLSSVLPTVTGVDLENVLNPSGI
jgi:hypothetical protein